MTALKRITVLTGEHAGQTFDAIDIGIQQYPDQIKIESTSHDDLLKMWQTNKEGYWIPAIEQKIERESRPTSADIDDSGVSYGNVIDTVTALDKYNNEIFVGDILFVASKNAVRKVQVKKIAKTPTWGSYGICFRKLTVVDVDDGQTLVISNPEDTIKV